MTRFAVYSFAALMDVVLSAVLFVCMVRTADMGASARAVAALMSVWAASYMITSLMAGRLVTRRSAAWMLIGSCLATVFVAIAFITIPGRGAMYVLMVVQGVVAAMFFPPFQVFMKYVDQGRNLGVCQSAGVYTCSWSLGFALGPFIAGILWTHAGWQGTHMVNIAICVVMAIGIFLLKHHAHVDPESVNGDASGGEASADAYAAMPDLAWMAWVFGGIGCMMISLIRSVFPSSGEAWSIAKADQGVVMCIMSLVQAMVGLALARSRIWMYRPLPVLGFGLFGIGGLLLFGIAQTSGTFSLAAACFGVYSGSFYFYFVFHSLVHPTRSGRYVALNEAVVGLASILGPTLGGELGDRLGLGAAYMIPMALLGVAIVTQSLIHARYSTLAKRI